MLVTLQSGTNLYVVINSHVRSVLTHASNYGVKGFVMTRALTGFHELAGTALLDEVVQSDYYNYKSSFLDNVCTQ